MTTFALNHPRVLSPGEVREEAPQSAEPEEWTQNLNIKLICPECRENPPNLYENFAAGDTICGSCGLVLAERIVDTRSEWRTFSNDDQGNDDPSRVGEAANPLLNGSQLTTSIAYDGGAKNRDLQRSQNKSSQQHEKANKTLMAAYKQISMYCDSSELPRTVSDAAKQIFKLVDDHKQLRGKSQEAIIAGCIFIACRQTPGASRTFREIYALTKVSKKEIGRTFKALEEFLKKYGKETGGKTAVTQGGTVIPHKDYQSTESTKASELCNRVSNRLGLSRQASQVAFQLAEKMEDVGALAGRSPLSAAAACIYMASYLMGEPKTPKDISKPAGVSDGTIRTAYKHIYERRHELIDEKMLARGGDMTRLPAA